MSSDRRQHQTKSLTANCSVRNTFAIPSTVLLNAPVIPFGVGTDTKKNHKGIARKYWLCINEDARHLTPPPQPPHVRDYCPTKHTSITVSQIDLGLRAHRP